jgi:hypothetical protein
MQPCALGHTNLELPRLFASCSNIYLGYMYLTSYIATQLPTVDLRHFAVIACLGRRMQMHQLMLKFLDPPACVLAAKT